MQNVNWDDLRYCLAVVREGSVTAAARRLAVNHTTVSRRVTALEQELNASLFDRSTAGWLLTPFGERILGSLERMSEEAFSIQRNANADRQELRGQVRVTAVDISFRRLLLPGLREFSSLYPEISIEMLASDQTLNLAVHEADIAFRVTDAPPPDVLGTRIATLASAIYATPELIERHARDPQSVSALTWHWDGKATPSWLQKCFPDMPVRFMHNSLSVGFEMARAGFGFTKLPCSLGDMAPELRRVAVDFEEPGAGFWVLSHVDLRTTARLRIFRDFMIEAISPHVPLLEGQRENAWRDPAYANVYHLRAEADAA